MKKNLVKATLLITILISLTNCNTTKLTRIENNKSEFQIALANDYTDLANKSVSLSENKKAKYFFNKARKISKNQPVYPENLKTFRILPANLPEITRAHETLIYLLKNPYSLNELPIVSAKAQSYFDCWLKEQNTKKNDYISVDNCRENFYYAISELNSYYNKKYTDSLRAKELAESIPSHLKEHYPHCKRLIAKACNSKPKPCKIKSCQKTKKHIKDTKLAHKKSAPKLTHIKEHKHHKLKPHKKHLALPKKELVKKAITEAGDFDTTPVVTPFVASSANNNAINNLPKKTPKQPILTGAFKKYFKYNLARGNTITNDQKKELAILANNLKNIKDFDVNITSYSRAGATEKVRIDNAQSHAQLVKNILQSYGVKADNILIFAYGEYNPDLLPVEVSKGPNDNTIEIIIGDQP